MYCDNLYCIFLHIIVLKQSTKRAQFQQHYALTPVSCGRSHYFVGVHAPEYDRLWRDNHVLGRLKQFGIKADV